MWRVEGVDVDHVYCRGKEIDYVHYKGKQMWEHIIGYLFDKTGHSLQSKDGYILKAKNQ